MLAWWDAFKKGKILNIFTYREREELIGLFPFYMIRIGPFRELRFIGQPLSADRIDFILRPGYETDVLTQFANDLFADSGWDLLNLREFSPLSEHLDMFTRILKNRGKSYTRAKDHACYYIPTRRFKDYETFYKTTSSRNRKGYRLARNRIQKEKNITWEIRDEIDHMLISEMVELDLNRSYRGASGSSFLPLKDMKPC